MLTTYTFCPVLPHLLQTTYKLYQKNKMDIPYENVMSQKHARKWVRNTITGPNERGLRMCCYRIQWHSHVRMLKNKESNIFVSGLLEIKVVSGCRKIIPCCSLIQHSRINAFTYYSAKTNKKKTCITCKSNRTLSLIHYLCYGLIILVIGNRSWALSFTNLIFRYPTRLLFLQNG